MRWIALLFVFFVGACGASAVGGEPLGVAKLLTVQSEAFADGGAIPEKFTADGANTSPPLSWSAGPAGTKSYAVVMNDPDAPDGTFTHWLLWNLANTSLPESITPYTRLSPEAMQGRNSFDRQGYGGPAPPSGTHRYVLRVYALDSMIELTSDSEEKALVEAMRGHALGYGQIVGKYAAKK